jgi:hypothetical protein
MAESKVMGKLMGKLWRSDFVDSWLQARSSEVIMNSISRLSAFSKLDQHKPETTAEASPE